MPASTAACRGARRFHRGAAAICDNLPGGLIDAPPAHVPPGTGANQFLDTVRGSGQLCAVNYDIIGDVHGQYDKLVALLKTLGYRETLRSWRHPDRTAIFIGDLIDRGPKQLETLKLVWSMVDSGAARAIMGNHEFNAIAWATRDPEHRGKHLRRHDRPGHRAQHKAFLDAVEGEPLHDEIIGWFKTLPLWLDLGAIRVVHACWNDKYMDELRPHLGAGATLTDELIVWANRKEHWAFEAVEAICKGPEVDLPPGISFKDKDGKDRRSIRVRWWEKQPLTFKRAALAPAEVVAQIPDVSVKADSRIGVYSGPPVFFGHYWLTERPAPMTAKVACVDYSAGNGGLLVAYRWEGEPELRATHFIWT
jgi:Calcineurin-like phosphoesterase